MKIRQTSNRSLLLSALVIASLITLTLMHNNISTELYEAEQNRSVSLKLADTLRNSSDELTQQLRAYLTSAAPSQLLTTGKLRAAQKDILQFEQIEVPSATVPKENSDEAEEVIRLASGGQITPEEHFKLRESRKLAAAIEEIENKAISLLNAGNKQAAVQTLDSDAYRSAKAAFYAQITAFVDSVDRRSNQDVEKLNAKKEKLFKNYGFLLFIIIAATVFEYLWGAKKFIAPIENLTRTASTMAGGDYSQRAKVDSDNEVGVLASTFNEMAKAIEEDIEERKRIAEEMEALRQKAEDRSNELEVALGVAEEATKSKGDFLASMSHEIRTPMNGVVGMADLLSETKLDTDQRQMLNIIRDSGNALLTIINDILDFSKIEAGKLEIESIPFSLFDVVEGSTTTIAPNATRKGVRIINYIDPAAPSKLLGDPVRLRQIIFNLTGNAVKFSEQGEVVVRADMMGGVQGGKVNLRISVIDQGIGISEDAIESLFAAFSQAESSTTRRFGGTGLGLTICKRLTELMGGSIGVESVLGSGSTFYVDLPLEIAPPTSAQPENPDLSDLRILCVSESDNLNKTMSAYLRRWSADVQTVSCHEEADGLSLEIGDFDVAVLDCEFDADRQKAAIERLAQDDLTFVVLTERQRRTARLEDEHVVSLDANPLRHDAFVNAVSVAVGRASPLVAPDAEEGDTPGIEPLSVEEAMEQGSLILLAEDNPTNRQVIGRQLAKLGYTCEMADDGKLALEAWRSKPYGLLLTDCHMPNMDGFELTANVRADETNSGKRSPIIAVTANALAGEAERCIAAGMDDYLSKPLAMHDLKAALNKWLPQARPKTPSVEEVQETEVRPAGAVEPTYLRETFGDDPDMIRDILQDYTAPARSMVGEIDEAFSNRDCKAIGAAAHKLKSSSRSIGADLLADLCQDLEHAGKSGDWKAVETRYPELAPAMEAVVEAIETF